jgi:protein-tyrosine phosphatase
VFGGSSPVSISTSNSLGTAVGGTVLTISSLDTTHRWYFDVEQQGGTPTTVAARHVTLSGPVNFRDLGGYPTADGRHTKWGVFFRSDQLSSLTAADATYLVNSGITHDVDLRLGSEAASNPDIPATDNRFTYVREPVQVAAMQPSVIIKSGVVFDETTMAAAYELTLTTYASEFAGVFQALAAQGAGSVFHCTYGKDRTGLTAALLLMAANVPDSVIIAEYNLTDQYEAVGEAELVAQMAASLPPAEAALFGVSFYSPPAVMQAVLTYIRQTYGSAGAYLQTGGLDPATLAKVVAEFVQ